MSEPEAIPATIPAMDGEWLITLNGYVLRESDMRRPVVDLPIDGKVTGDATLGENPAVVDVVFSENRVEKVYVEEFLKDMGYTSQTYSLTLSGNQPERGERWTTQKFEPEATVEILPPGVVEVRS